MPLQATSGAASYDAFGGGVPVVPNYIEDVFNVWLHTGSSSSNQTITNGIDLAGKGGLVWQKGRNTAFNHAVFDSGRSLGLGTASMLNTNTTNAEATGNSMRFDSTGFTMGVSDDAAQWASWTIRKQPKFFDVVTWTSTNNANARISHNLGSVPGCYIIKRTDSAGTWFAYHASLGRSAYVRLNTVDGSSTNTNCWGTTDPTTTDFGVNETFFTPGSGNYVAYLFAHDAGGFGLTGTDNVISCGSFTTDVTGGATVNLGYEPQWILVKQTDASAAWYLFDVMRNFNVTTNAVLNPNTSDAETSFGWAVKPTATGFDVNPGRITSAAGQVFIYITIRRGPMKVPTSGTSVYNGIARTGNGTATTISNSGFTPDMVLSAPRTAGSSYGLAFLFDRLRGPLKMLETRTSQAEQSSVGTLTGFDTMNGYIVGTDAASYGAINTNSVTYINWNFRRAPSFFDEVCYTGTGTAGQTFNHNLGVVPEMMIVKGRSIAEEWNVYYGVNTTYLKLNSTDVAQTATTRWNDTSPTSSVFSLGTSGWVNQSGSTYVAYLFATCAGVSKVGSVTHVEPTTVVCGFTPRFVMLKSTASTGTDDWFVFDSARGIVSGNDPYLRLNSTGAENTPFGAADLIDPTADGFIMNGFGGGNYIFLAIA